MVVLRKGKGGLKSQGSHPLTSLSFVLYYHIQYSQCCLHYAPTSKRTLIFCLFSGRHGETEMLNRGVCACFCEDCAESVRGWFCWGIMCFWLPRNYQADTQNRKKQRERSTFKKQDLFWVEHERREKLIHYLWVFWFESAFTIVQSKTNCCSMFSSGTLILATARETFSFLDFTLRFFFDLLGYYTPCTLTTPR